MINFFRKIRKQLADDNKPLKYARYAIGEIVLVVVGILIALSINNWNEERKANILENEFLKRLKNDLVNDTNYFQQRKEDTQVLIEQYKLFLIRSYDEQDSFEEFQELMCCIDYPPTELHINTTTYSEMVSTGEINIIKKIGIRESVIRHYENYNRINKHLVDYDGYSNLVLGNLDKEVKPAILLKKYFPNPEEYVGNLWEFINDSSSIEFRNLENTVAIFLEKLLVSLEYLQEIDDSTKELLLIIDEEI